MHSIAFILLLAPVAHAHLLYAESYKVIMGKHSYSYYTEVREIREYKWFTYQGSEKIEVTGCEVSPGVGILFGETFKAGDFVYRCDRGTEYMSRITPLSCLFRGQEVKPGQKIAHGYFAYSCVPRGKMLVFQATSCLDDKRKEYGRGSELTVGGVVYKCMPEGDGLMQKAVGCVIAGKQVSVHRSITVDNIWYKCARAGIGGVEVQIMGCVSDTGVRVDVGRTFRKGAYVYKCKARGSSVEIVLAGCVGIEMGRYKDFGFGTRWFTRPIGVMGYMVECNGNEWRASQEISHCVVSDRFGRKAAPVGCGTTYGFDKIFTCKRLRDGNVEGGLSTIQKGKSAFEAIAAQGVRYC